MQALSDNVTSCAHVSCSMYLLFVELRDAHVFELEACRSLLAMFDANRTGVLEIAEVRR